MSFLVFLINFTLILILPGYLLMRLLFREERASFLESIPIAFCFSLGIITIPSLLVQIFRCPLVIVWWFLFTATALLGLVNLLIFRSNKGIDSAKKTALSVSEKRLLAIFLLLIIVFGIAAYLIGGFISWDPLTSLGYIQRNLQSDYAFATDVDFKEFPPPEDAYNVWDMALFLLAYLTRISPVQAWTYLPAFLMPITTLAFFFLAKQLFKNTKTALLSAILFILYHGVYNRFWVWQIVGYFSVLPNFTLLPVSLAFFFQYLSSRKIKYAWLTVFLGFVMVKTWIMAMALLLVSLFSFAIFTSILLQKDQRMRIIKQTCLVVLLILIVNGPYLWYSVYTQLFYTKSRIIWMFIDTGYLNKNLYYIHPIALFSPHHYVPYDVPYESTHRYFGIYITIAFCLTPFLLLYTRKSKDAVFLFSNMVLPPLVMLNPLLVPLLTMVVPMEFVRRLGQLLPFILVLGFFLSRGLSNAEQLFVKCRLRLPQIERILLITVLAILIVMPPFNRGLVQLFHLSKTELRYHDIEAPHYIPALKFLKEIAPPGSVILSEEYLSRHIPAYTGCYIVYPAADNFSIFVSRQEEEERKQCFKTFLDPSISIEETIKWLKKYDVSYVVINEKFMHRDSLLKIKAYPTIFQLLFKKNGIYVFRVAYKEDGDT